MKTIKREVIKEKFRELYLDRISDFDIEFLYFYIISTNKLSERYRMSYEI